MNLVPPRGRIRRSPGHSREECGNGILDVAEECDDGILNSDTTADACRTTCTLPICGDGSVDSSEECDDGNTNNDDDCMQNCHAAVCGDGFIQSLIEDCDDGNSNNNDACPSNCLWPETIFTVTSVPNQPLTPTTGAPIFPGPMSDDESVSVSIGFPFSFLSTVVTTVYPSTNGFLSVTDRHPSYSPESLPISGSGVGFIAWWWQDLYFDTSRSPVPAATTALLGTAPHRIRVFTFLNIPRIGSATGNLLNAEIRLYEGTNEIEVHYGELTSGSSLSSHATMGWQSLAGNGGMPLACGAACDDSNWPANTIYRYSPHD